MASDAFFPFADGLLAAIEAGATAAIQPGGSVRDEVIAAADQAGIAMLFTGIRHLSPLRPDMRRLLAALALVTLAACSGPSPYRNADLGGTVIWQEVVYGPDATLIVYLVDASGRRLRSGRPAKARQPGAGSRALCAPPRSRG